MKKYLEKIKTKTLETIDSCGCYSFTFYVLMIAAIIVSIFMGYITRGESIQKMLVYDNTDSFMDFFNSIGYGRHPYEQGVIYPPLMNVIYAFFGHFVSHEDMIMHGSLYIRTTQAGMIACFTYMFQTSDAAKVP